MKLKKLPGFSLGLIALAVGNAYATQLLDDYSILSYITDEESPIEIKDNNSISNGEYLTTKDESHAVKVDDGVTGYINNASVMTSGDGSYGISVDSHNKVLYISDSDIKTSGSVSDKGNNQDVNGGITASAVVSEFGGTIVMNGDNSVETRGAYSAGLLSQVNDSGIVENNTRLETTDKTNIVTYGENAVGVLACSSPGESRTCVDAVDAVDDEVSDSNSYEVISRADLKMNGGSITTNGTNSYGAYANGEKAYINLDYVALETGEHGSYAVAIRQGNIDIKNSSITTKGTKAPIAKIYNGGELFFSNVTAVSEQDKGISIDASNIDSQAKIALSSVELSSALDSIDVNKTTTDVSILNRSIITPGNNILVNNTGGGLNIISSDSTLNGATKLVSGTTTLKLSENTIWNMKDDSVVIHLTNSDSIINLSYDDGQTFTQGKTLTVKGNYVGNNGQLNIRTVLGDDKSATDRLIVEGNTSGSTTVYVKNAGGSGAATLNGIELITVNGDESPADAFRQGDARIAAGAFEYQLKQQGKNWYLTSYQSVNEEDNSSEGNSESTETPTPVLRPEAGSYVANLAAANTLFVMRLNDRAGETRYIDPVTEQERSSRLWLRQVGGHNAWRDSNGQLRTTSHRYVSQLGADLLTGGFTDSDSWRLGVMAGYARDYNSTHSSVSDYRSKGSVRGYSAGLYATWFADDISKKGAYIDAWAQYSWFKNSVKGDELAYESYSAKGATVSLEAGYGFALNKSFGLEAAKYTWIFQPQAQAIWMGVDHNAHTEANGSRIENDANNNIQTRLGFRTFIRTQEKNSGPHGDDFEPFVEMNWIHNSKDFAVSMNGVKVEQDGARNLGEIKLGVNGNLNSAASVWGNVGVQLGDNGYNDTAMMVGLKYKF
ncbi:TPA: autotransporter outer membrane beta-barrel domain-containing protein [Escherichia coli]|uniref:autotransporter YcgH n=7 Tax=Escherichia coli TaxID=562 RepID=UPI0018170E25|nr:autotransporter YcgH [Escherichia coli]EFE4981431.1 autotransporter outer membrane beta-barrel domain-containing protein [Escherichia coli]HAN3994963.1 autotransporter outer membrane beta-barrel domain-containing protein [Escherichia coli]HAX3497482.1 autotransporter outer membrane beta-barrel domain-containing protein [Escherichia coli]HAX3511976.1 autotransporter outer membrane beta-barrel domain-containing protein [Escherichia coli]HAX3620740.1 autotransporter outer membrane beta-barrel 